MQNLFFFWSECEIRLIPLFSESFDFAPVCKAILKNYMKQGFKIKEYTERKKKLDIAYSGNNVQ